MRLLILHINGIRKLKHFQLWPTQPTHPVHGGVAGSAATWLWQCDTRRSPSLSAEQTAVRTQRSCTTCCIMSPVVCCQTYKVDIYVLLPFATLFDDIAKYQYLLSAWPSTPKPCGVAFPQCFGAWLPVNIFLFSLITVPCCAVWEMGAQCSQHQY